MAKVLSTLKKERGASNLGILLFILSIMVIVYIGFQVMPFYYSYYELEGLMQAQAEKASELKDIEIAQTIKKEIKKLEIPVDPEELRINRYNGKIIIEISYSEVLYVDFGGGYDFDLWEFSFNPKGEAEL